MDMLRFSGAQEHDPEVAQWLADHQHELGKIAAHWFGLIRQSGADVRELLHDGYPTACVDHFPFAYVGAFKAHVNVGFFHGAHLPDPAGILEGSGRRMRHVKVKPGKLLDSAALEVLIANSYADIKQRVAALG